jgi:hypothetical protein
VGERVSDLIHIEIGLEAQADDLCFNLPSALGRVRGAGRLGKRSASEPLRTAFRMS